MELAWLEVFREVAGRGSLTGAAQALGYTQPAVSRQMTALEKSTGTRLFDRLPRGIRLTEEGRCLLGHAEAVLDRVRAARLDLAALRDLEAGRVRIGAIDSANAVLISPHARRAPGRPPQARVVGGRGHHSRRCSIGYETASSMSR